jgi:hypothetical protein
MQSSQMHSYCARADQNNVYAYLQSEIDKALENVKISSKMIAECSLNSFKAFGKKQLLSFHLSCMIPAIL